MGKWRRRYPKTLRAAVLLDPGKPPAFPHHASHLDKRVALRAWEEELSHSSRFKAIRRLFEIARSLAQEALRKSQARVLERMNEDDSSGAL